MNAKYEKEINKSVKEVKEAEAIPMCFKCLIEIQEGKYICQQCKVNLCISHAYEHLHKEKEHTLIQLNKVL